MVESRWVYSLWEHRFKEVKMLGMKWWRDHCHFKVKYQGEIYDFWGMTYIEAHSRPWIPLGNSTEVLKIGLE